MARPASERALELQRLDQHNVASPFSCTLGDGVLRECGGISALSLSAACSVTALLRGSKQTSGRSPSSSWSGYWGPALRLRATPHFPSGSSAEIAGHILPPTMPDIDQGHVARGFLARLQTAAEALNLTELPRRTPSQPPPPATGGSSFTSRSVSPQIPDHDPMNHDVSTTRAASTAHAASPARAPTAPPSRVRSQLLARLEWHSRGVDCFRKCRPGQLRKLRAGSDNKIDGERVCQLGPIFPPTQQLQQPGAK